MTRNVWRKNWLKSLNELTSLQLQESTWLDINNTNPHWSYIEFLCSYFDDILGKNGYQYFLDNSFITIEEYEIIENWHNLLDKYEEPNQNAYDNSAILNDTNWNEIVRIGENAKNKLAENLNIEEKRILTEDISFH